jgi:hypothetical protein
MSAKEGTMRLRKISAPILCLLTFLGGAGFTHAEKHYTYAPAPNKAVYFGHISYTEIQKDEFDPLVFGAYNLPPKKAILNFPLGAGDSVRTSSERRCEIQFDTGTILRLDYDTEIQIETILAPSLTSGSKISNIVLKHGQVYFMYKRTIRQEIFQVLTPNAAVKLDDNSVSAIKLEDGLSQVWVDEGKVRILYGPDKKHTDTHKLKKGRIASVTPDHQLLKLTGGLDQEFHSWNKNMNADFLEMHKGKTPLPKPIQRLPKAVFYFAQKYSNIHGEWLWDNFYGYVWRPFYNDHYPWGNWSPYYYGQWHMTNDQLFWIPMESWGWVPYHLGLWIWNKNKGWLWLPGSAFAPAWATWRFFFGSNMLAWRPLGPWDWAFGSTYFYGHYSDRAYPVYPGTDPTKGKEQPGDQNAGAGIQPKIYPPYQIPGEFKGIIKKVKEGVARNDARLMTDIQGSVRHYQMVNAKYLDTPRIHEKRIDTGEMEATIKSGVYRESPQPSQAAVNLYWIHGIQSQIRQEKETPEKSEEGRPTRQRSMPAFAHFGSSTAPPAGLRGQHFFRDWNPDAKHASRQDVVLRYVSRHNAISAPEISFSRSGQRRGGVFQGYSNMIYRGGSSYSTSSAGSDVSSGSTSSSRASGTSSSSSGASRGSGGTRKK